MLWVRPVGHLHETTRRRLLGVGRLPGAPRLDFHVLLWRFGMLFSLGLSAGAVPAYLCLGRGRLKDWDRASLRPLFRPFILLWATVVGAFAFLTFIQNWN